MTGDKKVMAAESPGNGDVISMIISYWWFCEAHAFPYQRITSKQVDENTLLLINFIQP